MVKKVILGSLLSMAVVLMGGTAAFAATPPASCAAHCATYFGGSGQAWSVSAMAKGGMMGGPTGIAQMGDCPGGPPNDDCCTTWAKKFDK
jgi:hypothetical protein